MSRKGPPRVIKAAWAAGGEGGTGEAPRPRGAPVRGVVHGTPPEPVSPAMTMEEARRRARALEQQASLLLEEAREAAEARLAEAGAEAERILAAARQEAEVILAEAREQGWAEGYPAGEKAARAALAAEWERTREAAAQELAAAREEAAAIRTAALAERERLLAGLEPELIALSLTIARQILRAEIQLQPGAVAGMVAAALAKVRGEEQVRLRLHPGDVERVATHRAGWQPALGGGEVELVPDPALDPGEFILQSGQGVIDGRLDAQLQQVAAALSDLGAVRRDGQANET